MSEGGPSDDESPEKDVENLRMELDSCLNKIAKLEDEMFIRLKAPKDAEVERLALWARCDIKEMTCIYDLQGILEKLATEERNGQPWFEWLEWALFGRA